jgi:ketosteroid isomerase-like protein
MKNFLKTIRPGLILSLLFILACKTASVETPAPDLTQIRAEIQDMENAYAVAQNAKDVEAIMMYYASDAVSLPNEKPMVSGTEAIMNLLKEDMMADSTGNTSTFEVMDIFADGKYVVETGKSTVKDSTGAVVRTGKYMSLFEKRDGKYVCIRDIFNTDAK